MDMFYLRQWKLLILFGFFFQQADGAQYEWSEWGVCSSTCGRGFQYRTRLCTDTSDCEGFSTHINICDPEPCQDANQFEDLVFSGFQPKSNDTFACFAQCFSYRNGGLDFYSYVIGDTNTCFCSRVTVPALSYLSSRNNGRVLLPSCNVSSNLCESSNEMNPQVSDLKFFQDPIWLPDQPMVNETLEVYWFSTATRQMLLDDSISTVLSFDPKIGDILEDNTIKQNVAMFVPGHHLFSMTVNFPTRSFTREKIITIGSLPGNYKLTLPSILTFQNLKDLKFTMNQGINVNVTLSFHFGDEKKKKEVNFLVDIFERRQTFGGNDIDEQTSQVDTSNDKLIAIVEYPLLCNGSLNYLHVNVVKTGVLKIAILRSSCHHPFPYFNVKVSKCERKFRDGSGVSLSHNKFTLVTTILLFVNATGYQEIQLVGFNAAVKQGDFLAFHFTKKSAILACSNMNLGYRTVNIPFFPNEGFAYRDAVKTVCSPKVRATIAKTFQYSIEAKKLTEAGTMSVGVSLSSPYLSTGPIMLSGTVNVPSKIAITNTISFIPGQPKRPEVGFYSYKEKEEFIRVTVQTSSKEKIHVILIVDGKEHQSEYIKPRRNYTHLYSKNIPPGIHELVASVTENGQTTENRTLIEFVKPIISVGIDASDRIIMDKGFDFSVIIKGGSGVTVEVDFSDGKQQRAIIPVASENGYKLNITHRFTECKDVTINVAAYNKINQQSKKTASKSFIMFCKLDKLVVETQPKISSSGVVYIMPNQIFLITIQLKAGSFVDYIIDWGDNSSSTRHDRIVAKFGLIHNYRAIGNYRVNVTASSAGSSLVNTFEVRKRHCSPPTVALPNEDDPIVFFEVDEVKIEGTWALENKNCSENIDSMFQYDSTTFLIGQTTAKANFAERNVGEGFVLFLGILPAGYYKIQIQMRYNNTIYIQYNVSMNVIAEELVAKMGNSEKRKIPSKTLNQFGDEVHHDILISAEGSYDPYFREQGLQGISVSWSCRCLLSNNEIMRLLNETKDQNSVICTSKIFEKVPQKHLQGKNIVVSSKFMLGEGSFEFVAYLEKGKRNKTVTGKLQILKFISPVLNFSCVENCFSYVNPKEPVRYNYSCQDCPRMTDLYARWTIRKKVWSSGKILYEDVNSDVFDGTGNTPNLLIARNMLEEDSEYTCLLRVCFKKRGSRIGGCGDSDSYSENEFTFNTTGRPRLGTCSINLPEGMASRSKFMIQCSEWQSVVQSKLYYEFKVYSPSQENNFTIGQKSEIQTLSDVELIEGDKNDDYNLVIWVVVYDEFDMFIEIAIHVKVRPFEMTYEEMLKYMKKHNEWKSLAKLTNFIIDLYYKALTYFDSLLSSLKKIERSDVTNTIDENVVNKIAKTERKRRVTINEIIDVSSKELYNFLYGAYTLPQKRKRRETPDVKTINELSIHKFTDHLVDIAVTMSVLVKYPELVSSYAQNVLIDLTRIVCKNITSRMNEMGLIASSKRDRIINSTLIIMAALDKAAAIDATRLGKGCDEGDDSSFQEYNLTYEKWNLTMLRKGEMSSLCKLSMLDLLKTFQLLDQKGKFYDGGNIKIYSKTIRGGEVGNASSDGGVCSFPETLFENINLTSVQEPIHLWVIEISKETSKYGSEQETCESKSKGQLELVSPVITCQLTGKIVSGLLNPILIRMPQNTLEYETVSLWKPSEFKKVSLSYRKGACENLMLQFSYNTLLYEEDVNFTVYIQYVFPASPTDYDLRLDYTGNQLMKMNSSQTTKQNLPNDTEIDVKRNINYEWKNNTLILINLSQFTYGQFAEENVSLHFEFVFHGDLPPIRKEKNSRTYDISESRQALNLSLVSSCKTCMYTENADENGNWSSEGVEFDYMRSTLTQTICLAYHLSAFGSFYVAPNPLPPFSFSSLKDGFVLLVTVLVLLLFWLLGLVIARKIDKKDFTKIGVSPLPDNKPGDSYLYEITVNTGNRRHSGTTSKVFFTMAGVHGKTRVQRLEDNERTPFQTGSVDIFILATSEPLGDLAYIQVWHDNSGGSWYLRSIEVTDLQTEEKDVFLAARWLAVDKLDGRLDCVVHAASEKDMAEFNYLFTSKTRRDFSDAHLWFSVYLRPPRSSFTRCQRLSVAFCLLFTSMIASCMFYDAEPSGNPAEENRIAGFSFRWTQVYIAFICACITVPINLILVTLFRSIKPDYLERVNENTIQSNEDNTRRDSTVSTIVTQNEDSTSIDMSNTEIETPPPPKKKREKKFYLPHWCLIPAWLLCVVTILTCSFFIIWYGMSFGNQKSLNWLSSISISLVQDIIIMQPLKVFILALFVALIVKKIDEEEKSEIEKQTSSLAKDNSWLNKLKDETTVFDRVECEDLHPPDLSKLGWMREIRIKEVQMYAITREMILYLVFTCLVFIIGYFTRDTDAFLQTRNIEELLSLKPRVAPSGNETKALEQIQSATDFWPWMDNLFLREVFPSPWYDDLDSAYDDTPQVRDFPGKIFLNDLNSKIVNGIRLRQVRVKPDSCDKAEQVEDIIELPCGAEYGHSTEETRHFDYNWSKPIEPADGLTALNKPWRYQTWTELDAYPVMAELDTYYGGGYVAEIFPRWDNPAMLGHLRNGSWIDRYSRAIIIEFTLYNAATNYFDAIVIVIEFPPGGGVVHFHSVMTYRLYRLTNSAKIFVIACEVLFMLFMIMFTVREMKLIHKLRWAYFKEFWNLVELSNIFLTIAAIVAYIYRDTYGSDLLERLPSKRPDKFINFQFASFVDLFFTYIIALICFFVTLKFIKLLRFNRRISLMSHTLKRAWYPLSMFGITFSIIIIATIISSSLIFGTNLYDYRDVFKTIASIIGLLLGKFRYHEFEEGNRVLGPVFFFGFNVMVNWIIMNMMIAILTDTFNEVQEELLSQENDYEIIDFIVGHFKDWLGLQNSKQVIDELIEENMGTPESDEEEDTPARQRKRSTTQPSGRGRTFTESSVVDDFDDTLLEKLNARHDAILQNLNVDDDYTTEELFEMADKFAQFF